MRDLKICFYISDYGFGHASRDIAVIRALQERCSARVFVKTDGPHWLVARSLPGCTVIRTRNDIGLVSKGPKAALDRDATWHELESWIDSWNDYVLREKAFCLEQDIDVILSDISPQPFIVADEIGIPGIGISNFTWHFIFHHLFGSNPATDRLKQAYSLGSEALMLPFNEEMGQFKRRRTMGLVSRSITEDRLHLRRRLGVPEGDLLVYLGLGRSLDPSLLKGMKDLSTSGVRFLVSSNLTVPLKNSIRIPAQETETQNYIAMCDLVASKTGYSTVSEAIRARVSMILFMRDGFKEDRLLADGVEKMGIGHTLSEDAFIEGGWIEGLADAGRESLKAYKTAYDGLDGRFKRDGAAEAVDAIMEAVL